MGNKSAKHSSGSSTSHHHSGLSHHAPKRIKDEFATFEEAATALRRAGVESSNLIVGVDFTKSNSWNGGNPYYPAENLHSIVPGTMNLYQQVITAVGRTLEFLDEDKLIPAYFGDSRTKGHSVFPFLRDQATGLDTSCHTFGQILQVYSQLLAQVQDDKTNPNGTLILSGPTTFAPLIRKAIEIVNKEQSYHILLIICDGEIEDKHRQETIDAIVAAAEYPLSIICVGVGNGPWDVLKTFDNYMPKRKFDNFQFVDFYETMQLYGNNEVHFATHAMMEIPEQYKYIKENIL